MATPVKVKKWGSSMALLIPSQFAKMRDINVGTVLDLEKIEVVKSKRRHIRFPNSSPDTSGLTVRASGTQAVPSARKFSDGPHDLHA